MISSGRVSIEGMPAKSGSVQVEEYKMILFDGTPIQYQKFFYIMLHKPAGVVCANRDSRSKTVFDLLKKEDLKKDLFVCGRLDKDTTGFVLLTNNGPLAHRLLAPKKDVFKEYFVVSRSNVSAENIEQFKQGIVLRDGVRCKPAFYEPIDENIGLIRISEGKFHQIKKMFFAINNEVLQLHRNSIHGLYLDEALLPGEYRYLNISEIEKLENE